MKLFLFFMCLVEERLHYASIGGVIDDYFLEANRAIVIYLCDG